MLGWMDDEALHRTLTTGRVTFWSRSRGEYWRKGDTSGPRPVRALGRDRLRRRRAAGPGGPGRRRLPHRYPHVLRRGRTAARGRRRAARRGCGRRTRGRPDDRSPRGLDPRAVEVPWGTTWPALDEFRELAADRRVIPVVRRLLADDVTPVGLYRTLAQGRPGTFVLESAESDGSWSRHSFVGVRSRATLTVRRRPRGAGPATCRPASRSRATPLEVLGATLDALRTPAIPGLPPLTGGLVGALGWDIVRHWEPTLPAKAPRELDVPGDDAVPGDRPRRRRPRRRVGVAHRERDQLRRHRRPGRRGARGRRRAAGRHAGRARAARHRAATAVLVARPGAGAGVPLDPRRSTRRRSRPASARSTTARCSRSCSPSAWTWTARPTRWTSTACCGPSTRARTCTCSRSRTPTGRTSRWSARARRPSSR